MKNKILFRVDGNPQIASGHIMRCISYAFFFKKSGYECVFITASNDMADIIKQSGFKHICLNSVYTELENELSSLQKIISEHNPDLLVIDSYYVTHIYLETLTKQVKTLYIDDLNSFYYPVSAILNYSIYAKDLNYAKDKLLFLGVEYLALRPQFSTTKPIKINKEINNIFITTGAADTFDFCTNFLIDKSEKANFETVNYHIIVGGFFTEEQKAKLLSLCSKYQNIKLYSNVDNMAELMAGCDVAISAGGSTLYELCSLHIPTIAFITAENQINNVEGFVSKGIMLFGGGLKDNLVTKVQSELIFMSYDKRCEVKEKMNKLKFHSKLNELLLIQQKNIKYIKL